MNARIVERKRKKVMERNVHSRFYTENCRQPTIHSSSHPSCYLNAYEMKTKKKKVCHYYRHSHRHCHHCRHPSTHTTLPRFGKPFQHSCHDHHMNLHTLLFCCRVNGSSGKDINSSYSNNISKRNKTIRNEERNKTK